MLYPPLDLYFVGFVVGLLLIGLHAWALARQKQTAQSLARFPRADRLGQVLLTAAAIWFWLLIFTMDLGEFSNFRRPLLFLIPLGWFATIKFGDFLAVRSLGMLLLLAAEPVLEACWLHPELWRLLLVTLAYLWIVAGLFWVGMPYLLRDQIGWLLAVPGRLRAGCYTGIAYGVAIVICSAILRR
jgi:hypothetical protein